MEHAPAILGVEVVGPELNIHRRWVPELRLRAFAAPGDVVADVPVPHDVARRSSNQPEALIAGAEGLEGVHALGDVLQRAADPRQRARGCKLRFADEPHPDPLAGRVDDLSL